MPDTVAEHLGLRGPRRRGRRIAARVRREWCFARVALRHFRIRFAVMVFVLLAGAGLFRQFEPERALSLPQAVYFTWSLIFGEPPQEFPSHPVLQALFFIVPIIGLTVIIEGIVDLALLLRDRRRHERSWCTMIASSLKDHIVLVGLGKLGFRTYLLLRELEMDVVVIERNEKNQFLEVVRRDGSPLLIGDARREALLADANLMRARSVVLATDDDLANLEIALDARRIHPGVRVVLRMFDQNMADKIKEGFNLHIAMSQSAISAPAFAAAAMESSIVSSMIVEEQLIVMQRWRVRDGGPLSRLSVGNVLGQFGFSVVQHKPAGGKGALFPPPSTVLEPGDELLVQGPFAALKALRERVASLT